MLFRTAALLCLLAPVSAQALSCAPPNYGAAFNRVAAAEEVYSLAYGQLRPADAEPDYIEGQPREAVFAFVGKLMGSSGFGETQTLPVTVKTTCQASWCGPFPPTDVQMMMFLEQVPGGLVLTSSACPSDYMIKPSLGQVSAIRACMTAGTCGADELDAFTLE